MSAWLNLRNIFVVALVVMLALVPVYAALIGNYFLMSLFTRIVILAMAAVSLNLIMGFGGMVSFGHAAYLGIGAMPSASLPRRASIPASCNGLSP